jgi:Domain of Unknown Function (DUF1259)
MLLSVFMAVQQPVAPAAPAVPADYQAVLTYLGKQGDFAANVLRVNIPRNDLHVTVAGVQTPTAFGFGGWLAMTHGDGGMDLHLTEMGAPITTRMGLNTWAAFVGTDARAAIAGDVAMLAEEVTPVLKALRASGLEVVAIHQHMTATQPTIYFLHYWGTGPAQQLATAFKAALDKTAK